jgi:rod shape-determining protein MreC
MPKKWLLLLLFIIVTLSLMTYQSNRQHLLPFHFLTSALNRFHEIKTSLLNTISAPFHRMILREEENVRLRTEAGKMLEEQYACREVFLENKRLREILSLKEKERRYVTSARVIGRSSDQWSNTLILDKGTSSGIAKDMIAVTEKGLAGKISGVTDSYSYLLLVGDINFSVAVRLQENRAEGVVSGTGFRKCQLKYIPYEEEVKKDDIVITSGLDMLFPSGIPVGFVSRVNKKDIGFFQDIEMLPFVDTSKIEIVAIIHKE